MQFCDVAMTLTLRHFPIGHNVLAQQNGLGWGENNIVFGLNDA